MSVIKHHDQSNLSKADFGFVVLEDESHHPSLSQWGSTAAGTELTAHISNRKQRKSELKTTSILPSVSNSLPSARPQPLKFIQTRPPTGDQALERPETQGRSYSNPHRVWQAKLELTLHLKKMRIGDEDWAGDKDPHASVGLSVPGQEETRGALWAPWSPGKSGSVIIMSKYKVGVWKREKDRMVHVWWRKADPKRWKW